MKFTTATRCLITLFAIGMSTVALSSEIVSDSVNSKVLGRNIPFTVYLPDDYQKAAGTFPVVYLLHGADEDEYTWIRKGGVTETLDGLIHRGLLRPTIVVMPTMGPQSWWTNGAKENDETAMMTELLPYVENKYKVTHNRSGGRAIAGLSMGGYGALNLSLRYPEKFCAAGIISPAIYSPLPPETSASRKAPQFMVNGKFDPDTWMTLNYPAQLNNYIKGNVRVPMWIVSGDHDRFGIALMATQLYWRIQSIQPKLAKLRIVDGDHEWMTFRDALPDALQYMDQQCLKVPPKE
jgi:S-formylglutathione hydrolase FrmB